MFSGFSWESDYPRCLLARRLAVLSSSAQRPDLPGLRIPTLFNGLFRQSAAVSLLRPRFTPGDSNGIFTVSSIGSASRLPLRSRLTLIRLALIRKPQSFGGRVSRPPYRYSYLHLLFHALQRRSSAIFTAHGMLPYHPLWIHGFGTGFMPDYYPRRIARLVSCYALFK